MDEECDNQNLRIGILKGGCRIETVKNVNLAFQKYIEAKYKINATYETLPSNEVFKWKQTEDLPWTEVLIVLSPLFVSAFWTILRRFHISLKSSNANSTMSIPSTCLESLWKLFTLFFFEPYKFIPKTLSIRILTGVWLLAVLILNITLSSVMRSSFSFLTYDLVDSLKDLRNSKKIFLPKYSKGAVVDRIINLNSVDNEDFRYVKDHVTSDTFLNPLDLLKPDVYTQLKENEYVFVNNYYILLFLGFVFRDKNLDNFIYISKPISENYMAYPYSFNSSRCYKINTIFEQGIMDRFETQWDKPIHFKDINLLEKLKWRIPDSETKAIQFHELLSVYLLFCYGITLSFLVITIELLTSVKKKRTRKLPLRRKKLRWEF